MHGETHEEYHQPHLEATLFKEVDHLRVTAKDGCQLPDIYQSANGSRQKKGCNTSDSKVSDFAWELSITCAKSNAKLGHSSATERADDRQIHPCHTVAGIENGHFSTPQGSSK